MTEKKYADINLIFLQEPEQVAHYTECKDKDSSVEFTSSDYIAIAVFAIIALTIIIGNFDWSQSNNK